jgi:hypothetical protein
MMLYFAFRHSMSRRTVRVLAPVCALSTFLACAGSGASVASSAAEMRPSASLNELTIVERDAGWQLLFDGRTFAGWRGLGYKTVPVEHWTIEHGTIKKIASGKIPVQADGQPKEGGDLMTERTYRDFELSWDWRMSPGGNSGVKYNVSEELSMSMAPIHAAKGFEYQMIDDDRHADGKLPTHRTGALYDLIAPPDDKPIKPVGEWNHSVLVFDGNHGEHWLNGRKVVEYELGSPAMTKALAASKYAPIPWFAVRRAGHIILQDHGEEVYFRNLKIRELHR